MRENQAYPTFEEMSEYMDEIVEFNIRAESYERSSFIDNETREEVKRDMERRKK